MDIKKLQKQPGYIIKMVAKPGNGPLLFELGAKYMRQSGASDHWVMCRVPGESEVLWVFEFFINEEIKRQYEESELADKFRDEILDLLAELPLRVKVYPESASWME